MSKTVQQIVIPIVVSLLMGFFVALFTGLVFTPAKSASLPGGSFSAGVITGVTFMQIGWASRRNYILPVLTALAGVLGWATYCLLF